MVQRIAVGQIRFNVPGLAADARGVVLGRQLVLRFAAVDRLVSFLRLASAEQSLDDLLPGLRIVRARGSGGVREVLVLLSATSTGEADALARAARTAGGQCFTGSGRHFVQYRDGRAPLGYDVDALVAGEGDLALYGAEQTVTYAITDDISLARLLLQLDLRRETTIGTAAPDLLWLTVRRGIGPVLVEHFERARQRGASLHVSAALCEPGIAGQPAAATPGTEVGGGADQAMADDQRGNQFRRPHVFWLMRVEHLPDRLLGLVLRTPGVTPFVPVADNVGVALGYRHPVHLDACRSVFPADRLFLLAPPPAAVTTVSPPPPLVPIADLLQIKITWGRPTPPPRSGPAGEWPADEARSAGAVRLTVPLRLEPAPAADGGAVATLIPWEQATWLRSICYALPATALRGYRIALLDRGLFVVAPGALDGIPIGRLFHAPVPGVFVPLGLELRPAVSPEHLAGRTGATGGAAVVFPAPSEGPFRIPADAFEPLEARVLSDPELADLSIPVVLTRRVPREPAREVEIENQPLGPLPVWSIGS